MRVCVYDLVDRLADIQGFHVLWARGVEGGSVDVYED